MKNLILKIQNTLQRLPHALIDRFHNLSARLTSLLDRLLAHIASTVGRRYFVLLDPRDNSVTFSQALFRHISRHHDGAVPRVFVFLIPQSRQYAFVVNPALTQETQLSDIQYNDHCRSIGFESLCPSVGRILYDYQLRHDTPVRLSVSINSHIHSIEYIYIINKPKTSQWK